MEGYQLKEREKAILRYVIHQFILTASPVGSRNISKKYELGLSPATIRNIMSDLEDFGLLEHPHTSAGRIPTDKGYRLYVDSLMDPPHLDPESIQYIDSGLAGLSNETDELLKVTSLMLSDITNQLALVTYPRFDQAILEKIQIVQLSSIRILVVVSIQSGMVKTITLELNATVKAEHLEAVQRFLNERLSGLRFDEIRATIKDRIRDYNREDYKPIVSLFLDSVDKIFTDVKINDKAFLTGPKHILKQPEFDDHQNLQGIIELIEDKDVIVHIMDSKSSGRKGDLTISIGEENKEDKLSYYSMVIKDYEAGSVKGTVGVMGPKRMEYSKIIAAVLYAAEQLSNELKRKS